MPTFDSLTWSWITLLLWRFALISSWTFARSPRWLKSGCATFSSRFCSPLNLWVSSDSTSTMSSIVELQIENWMCGFALFISINKIDYWMVCCAWNIYLKWYIFHPLIFWRTFVVLANSFTVGLLSSFTRTSLYRKKWLCLDFHVCL